MGVLKEAFNLYMTRPSRVEKRHFVFKCSGQDAHHHIRRLFLKYTAPKGNAVATARNK